ncbi:MAG: hypothetical protein ABEI97_03125 [Candidatus Nanohaloarchaea archaeon]
MRLSTRVLTLSVAVLLIAGAAAAQDTRRITVGGEDTVTASVSTPLQVTDVLTVTFNGPAVSTGIVDVDLPAEADRVHCSESTHTCRVILNAGEERDLAFGLQGKTPGSSQFMVKVSSATTGKRSEATMIVRVRGRTGGSVLAFLRRLLGMG